MHLLMRGLLPVPTWHLKTAFHHKCALRVSLHGMQLQQLRASVSSCISKLRKSRIYEKEGS